MSLLLEHVTAVTMDSAQPVLKDAFVAVEGTKIASVGTARPQGEFDRVIDGTGKVLMPGLVNAHTHVAMALLRGYGGGHDLHHWLNDYIFPAEDKLDARCVAAGTALGLAEMIASGTTCIADMYCTPMPSPKLCWRRVSPPICPVVECILENQRSLILPAVRTA